MPKFCTFISHVSGEAALAALLKVRIENDFLGLVKVFVSSDGTSIIAGEKWLDQVTEHLREADLYIALCSQESIERPWVNIELGAALTRDRQVIPLCHTDLAAAQLTRRPWGDYQALDMADAAALKRLYEVLALKLESTVPRVDFAEFATQVREFEADYSAQKRTISQAAAAAPRPGGNVDQPIAHPLVLCVSSAQFRATVREDLKLILAAFPDQTQHVSTITASEVKTALMNERFDIIHVASFVCPATGDLVFNEIDPGTKRDLVPVRDGLSAETFAGLVREAGASLVVLAHSETLALVTKLLPVTNVVFPHEPVDSKALIHWIETFYKLLADGHSIRAACRKTFALHQLPMILYTRLSTATESIVYASQ